MTSHKILVIDDSKVIRMRVKDMLPAGSFEVLEAKDGLDGFNKIQSESPNLIMLDFFLPKMSGWDVYQEIQKEPRYKAIPLVLMSGRKEEVTEKIPEPFELFSFLEKPFDQKQLIQGIKDAMQKAKKHKPPETSPPTIPPSAADTISMKAEIKELHISIAKMQSEIDGLKKQMSQLVTFIKQKLK